MKKTIFIIIMCSTSFCSLFSGTDSPKAKIATLTGAATLSSSSTQPIAISQKEEANGNKESTSPGITAVLYYDTPCGTSPVHYHVTSTPKPVTPQDGRSSYGPDWP